MLCGRCENHVYFLLFGRAGGAGIAAARVMVAVRVRQEHDVGVAAPCVTITRDAGPRSQLVKTRV